MGPAERITAVREIAELLAQQEWDDIDLALREYSLPVTDGWAGGKYGYVIEMLSGASPERLEGLHQYATGSAPGASSEPSPWRQGSLKLFMSHLAKHQEFVGYVGTNLGRYGVSCFVAHNSIEPSKEWQNVIEVALKSCDAMAVFLHKGFKESDWCDQEVGFALARRVPVLPLAIDLMPYGFMGKIQAARCDSADRAPDIAQKILNWLLTTPSAQVPMTEGVVTAFEHSKSFDSTRMLYKQLLRLPNLTPEQLQRLEAAARDNGQVRDAIADSRPVPTLIRKFVTEKGYTGGS